MGYSAIDNSTNVPFIANLYFYHLIGINMGLSVVACFGYKKTPIYSWSQVSENIADFDDLTPTSQCKWMGISN
jgi:hypothetical protein